MAAVNSPAVHGVEETHGHPSDPAPHQRATDAEENGERDAEAGNGNQQCLSQIMGCHRDAGSRAGR